MRPASSRESPFAVAALLLMIDVRDFRRLLQFLVRLIEQILGLRSMAGQIEFIGLLGRGDALEGVRGLFLRPAQVGVLLAADVLYGFLLYRWGCIDDAGCQCKQTQQQCSCGKFFQHVVDFLLVWGH